MVKWFLLNDKGERYFFLTTNHQQLTTNNKPINGFRQAVQIGGGMGGI